jgi:cellulose synthase operon protein C
MAATANTRTDSCTNKDRVQAPAVEGGATIRVFNTRLALLTLLAIAVLGPALVGWRYYQLQRTAKAYLERADQLEADGQFVLSAHYLHRYLSVCPGEDAVRIRMTETFDRGAKGSALIVRAKDLYYQTLGLISSEEDKRALRLRLTEILLELNRFTEAECEAREILKGDKNSPQGRRFLALALFGQIRSGAAVGRAKRDASAAGVRQTDQRSAESDQEVFESALKSNPGDVQLSVALAGFYRGDGRAVDEKNQDLPRDKRNDMADRVMAKMAEADPTNANVYLVRRQYRKDNLLAGADEDLRSALKFGPDNVTVLLIAADEARRDGLRKSGEADSTSFKKARDYCERVLKIAPRDVRGYLLLGDLDYGLGNYQDAIKIWRRGLKEANKDNVLLHHRLAGALVASGQIEEAAATLDTLDALIRLHGGEMLAADRAGLECSCDFIRAQWLLRQGDVAKAIPLLRRVANQGIESTNAPKSYEAWAVLGRVWLAQQEWDQAASAFEQACLLLPESATFKLAAAQAWENAGRYDTAIKYAEQALAIRDAPTIRVFLAEARCQQQMRLPKPQRDWRAFRKALDEALAVADSKSLSEPWRLKLTQADALAEGAMDKPAEQARLEAAELLRAAEKAHPKSAALLQLLPAAYEHVGCPTDADRAVVSLAQLPGQALPALLCRSQLCVTRKQFAKARETLTEGLASVPTAKARIRFALATICAQEGRFEQAFQELKQLDKEYPKQLRILWQLAELAWDLRKVDECRRCELTIREVEGADGVYWRYLGARRLLAEARDTKDERFSEAGKLVDELQTLRPSWPRTHSLCGQIEQRRGNRDRAIDAYVNAIRLGERRTEAFEQLTVLLYAERRFAEAEGYLSQLQGQTPISGSRNLSTMEISLAEAGGQLDRALAAAQRGVKSRPNDPTAYIWLGHILLAKGQVKQAEEATRKAVQLAPTDVGSHIFLWKFYVTTRQLDLALKAIGEMEKSVPMSDAERAFVLAQAYEMICYAGKMDADFIKKTKRQYEEAQRLNPNRLAVLQRRAAFLLQCDPAAADEVLANVEKSQQLMETPGTRVSIDDRRQQAKLLACRTNKESLVKARRILEDIISESQGIADDCATLAAVLDAEGKTTLAQQQYLAAVSRADADPNHVWKYALFLVRHDMNADAGTWIEKLRQQRPDDLEVCALHASWLHKQRRDSEIEPAVEAVAKRWLDKPADNDQKRADREMELSFVVGKIYTVAERHPAAERWYRRLVKSAPKQYSPLAESLARQNRLGEAVALCVEAAKTDHSPRPALVLANAIACGKATDDKEALRRADALLAKSLEDHSKDARLLSVVAGLRAMQQRTEDAVDLYRRVIALRPKDVEALNNLATMLAERPQGREEALRSIDEAITMAGRRPLLLDTKGTILIQTGKPDEAVPLLREATAGTNADPRFYFHLSLACRGTGKLDEARDALRKARDGNLMQTILTPTDRQQLKDLEQQLGM